MKLTRRQLLKNGLLLGSSIPFSMSAAWAGQTGSTEVPQHGQINLYGTADSTTELGLGLRQKGWAPRYEGRLDPLMLSALPGGTLAAGFTDEAGLVLLTSLLVGRGRILALGRHTGGVHHLMSQRGPLVEPLAVEAGSWQAALGREYARLALTSTTGRHAQQFHRPTETPLNTSELSFLVRL